MNFLRKLSPRGFGVFGLVAILAVFALTWYTIRYQGGYDLLSVILFVAVLPTALALVVLPTRWLLVPTETDGRVQRSSEQQTPARPWLARPTEADSRPEFSYYPLKPTKFGRTLAFVLWNLGIATGLGAAYLLRDGF